MRVALLISFVSMLCGATTAQKIVNTEKLVIYHPLKDFFVRNKEVKEIKFNEPLVGKKFEVELVTSSPPLISVLNQFQLENTGDRYFFEKEYGPFDMPESLYKPFVKRLKGWVQVSGTVRQDSVFFHFKQTIYRNDEEKVFIKVESRKDYQGGLNAFAKGLEDILAFMPVPAGDSVLLFRTVLDKSRKMTVLNIKLGDSISTYTNAVRKCIQSTNLWIPYEKDGHYMRSYLNLYIRRNSDGSYRVVMDW